MNFPHPAQSLTNVKERRGFVLGIYRGHLWIGVRFGDAWRPARLAHSVDVKFFN